MNKYIQMYNYSINLTYLDIEDDKQDTRYRKELLDVFDIKQYEHETIMTSIDTIYDKFGKHKQIQAILEELMKNSSFPFEIGKKTAFTMLFSFENFYLSHNAFQQLERISNIETNLYDKIIQNLQKK